MKNIEKYKDVLLNAETNDLTCCVIDLFHNGKCPDNCKVCKQKAIEWLLSEYKEPVLDEKERKYLSEVIRPFRKIVIGVCKHFFAEDDKQYICISVRNDSGFSEYINLPNFNSDTMYKGMKAEKWYSLQELGL